jgi:hypothetical protein
MFDSDIDEIEVDPPYNRWCASGHQAPELFKRGGPNSLAEPTRFFMVTCKKKELTGIYCEPCLFVAHYIASQNKTNKVFK